MTGHSPAVEVRDLRKSFYLPAHGPEKLRHRVIHPVSRDRSRQLRVLDGISFEVQRGEFFGIVGRNGSGKSTLLRLLASIYWPDSGTIKIAGRLAPIIELGTGFNPEFSARQNVVLNAVLLGLTPREARRRFDEIISFAELEEFSELKLKNFSSGMRVRLAFAVMVQADPDVFLIDEVLAVGDAAFQEKCSEVLRERRDAGRTIMLVTHRMQGLKEYCDQAMLLENGRIDRLGDPEEIARRYLEISGEKSGTGSRSGLAPSDDRDAARRTRARITDLWLERAGLRQSVIEEEERIELRALVEVDERIRGVGLWLELRDDSGAKIFASSDGGVDTGAGDLVPGERARARASIENPLPPGRYVMSCAVVHRVEGREIPVSPVRELEFEVAGPKRPRAGLTLLDHEIVLERQRSPDLATA